MKFILGKKLKMTQQYTDKGRAAVTVIEAGPCTVTQVKGEKDGYTALQVGFQGDKKKLSKARAGHLKGLSNFRALREFRTDTTAERGQVLTVDVFQPGDLVKVSALSKGRGFQGVVKRHGFHGSPKTHGHKDQLRMPGSIGAGGVQKVMKGVRMAGRMGGGRVTVSNLEVLEVDAEHNLLYLKGAVPGARNGMMSIVADGEMVFIDPGVATETLAVEKLDEKTEAPLQQATGGASAETTVGGHVEPVTPSPKPEVAGESAPSNDASVTAVPDDAAPVEQKAATEQKEETAEVVASQSDAEKSSAETTKKKD